MKKFAIIILGLIIISSLYGVDLSNRNMTLRLNGHDHLVHDIISDTLQSTYTKWQGNIQSQIYNYLDNQSGISSISVKVPSEISKITFCQGTSGNGQMNIRIPDWSITFIYSACSFVAEFDIDITAKMKTDVDTCYWLKIYDITNHGKINMEVEPRLWYQFWNYPWCWAFEEIVFPFIYEYQFADQFEDEMRDMRLEIFALEDLPGEGVDSLIVEEAIESFPIDFSFTHEGTDSNLVICMDFMKGTDTNPTAFTGIQPDPVTHDSYDHIGYGTGFDNFMYAYQASSWGDPDVDDPVECATTLLNLMSNTSTQSIRIEVPWLYIQGNIPTNRVNCGLNPDFLDTPAGHDSIDAFMNLASWQDFDSVLSIVLDNGIEPILNIGHGHTRHAPRIGSGLLMAPNYPTGQNDGTYFVDENTYLYYLKLFAHATVRKYRNKIAFWQIEGEFNVAKFNRIFYGWRLGNLWDDESSGGFQDKVWDILVNAVRTEDPTAKIVTNFHMLNLVKGLQRFGPDCDIIGLNVYPNLKFAYPVLGFVPGELVWATRRALKGLNMGDKDVWITETNYPALYSSDPSANISLDSNIAYYSYGRQADFLESALETSLDYGAKGFFWWSLWLYETATNEDFGDLSDYGGLIPKNTMNLKQPTASRFSTTTLNNHPGKCTVQLMNKNLSTGVNLGGKISLASERDSLNSGEIVYALRDRDHISRTDQRVLQGLVHNQWNTNDDFKLAESFEIREDWTSYNRDAFFTSTDNITISTNLPQVSIEFWDPWYYDEVAQSQPDCYRTVSPGDFAVFLDQNQYFENEKPIYHLKAPKWFATTNTIYDFVRWESADPSEAVFNASNAISTDSCETKVLFRMEGATVTAVYAAVNQIADYTLSIPSGETLTIPAGASISFADGFKFIVEGSLYIGGADDDPIELTGSGKDPNFTFTYGNVSLPTGDCFIRLNEGGDIFLENVKIEGVDYGLMLNHINDDCYINNIEISNSNVGIYLDYAEWDYIYIENANIHDNDVGISMPRYMGGGFLDLLRSVIANNTFYGVYVFPRCTCQGSTSKMLNFNINNCTFYDNVGKDLYCEAWGRAAINTTVYNSIFAGEPSVGFSGNPIPLDEADYNLMTSVIPHFNNRNNFVGNPGFINPDEGDFRLKSNSDAIDRGNPDTYYNDPDGTRADIGAYYLHQMNVSGTIYSNTTWYGKVTVTGDVTLAPYATLTINPGTIIFINPDKKIIAEGQIIANGTSSNPIKFKSTSGTWYQIDIRKNSQFNYCLFENGRYVYIRNQLTTFSNCVFKTMLQTLSGGTFNMNNCIIEDNYFGIGIKTATSGTSKLTNCTVRNCHVYGLHSTYDGRIVLNKTEVYDNGDGIVVGYHGILDLTPGRNAIINNNYNEININDQLTGIYPNNTYWYGDIYDNENPSPGYYIDNFYQTSQGENVYNHYASVKAERVWWGTTNTTYISQRFSAPGYIDFSPIATSSQTAEFNIGAPETGLPLAKRVSSVPVVSLSPLNLDNSAPRVASSVLSAGIAKTVAADENDDEKEAKLSLKESIQAIKNQIRSEPYSESNPGRFLKLYSLLREDPEDNTGEYRSVIDIVSQYRTRSEDIHDQSLIKNEKNSKRKELYELEKLTGEVCMIIEVDDLIWKYKKYDEALALMQRLYPKVTTYDCRRELKMCEIAIYKFTEDWKKGLEAVQELKEEVKNTDLKEYTPPDYTDLENEFRMKLGLEPILAKEAPYFRKDKEEVLAMIPGEFALKHNYPNPFNPMTTIPFDLPEASRVQIHIYDLSGRQVAVVASGQYSAGSHMVTFNGSSLPSGIYLIRAQMLAEDPQKEMHRFTGKMMLMK